MGAEDTLAAFPGDHEYSAAAFCLSHRRTAGFGCGPATEFGEECDGGVGRIILKKGGLLAHLYRFFLPHTLPGMWTQSTLAGLLFSSTKFL